VQEERGGERCRRKAEHQRRLVMTGTGTLALWHSGTIGGVCGPKISLQQLQGVCAPQL
jgi:hypothetical protein